RWLVKRPPTSARLQRRQQDAARVGGAGLGDRQWLDARQVVETGDHLGGTRWDRRRQLPGGDVLHGLAGGPAAGGGGAGGRRARGARPRGETAAGGGGTKPG